MRAFLAMDTLVAQLRDDTLKPPMCLIATNAVASAHEAKAYALMDAMVISDVTAQTKREKSQDARSAGDRRSSNTSSGDGKRRRKKSQRRR